mmetsp:Transcript_79346/g.220651  ORF Transcript_79346/g.220651 Transcript_79346/m.220651 type:complete len:187 (-) Transcript_79346:302-862(-)
MALLAAPNTGAHRRSPHGVRARVARAGSLAAALLLSARWDLAVADARPQDDSALDDKLIDAAGTGEAEQVVKLLAAGASVNARSPVGETPLHVAGIQCEGKVIQALLDAGAKVNSHTDPGMAMSMTPLHWYVNMNPCGEEHVRMLLDARADLNAKNSHGQTPFSMVSEIQGRQNIAKMVDPKRDEL